MVSKLSKEAGMKAVGSENHYRELFEGQKVSSLLIDPISGNIVEVNQAAESFYGYNRAQLLALNISDINILSKEQIEKEMQLAKTEKRDHFFFKHKLSNGDIRDVEVHSGPINWGEKNVLYSIIHDVTSRRLAEESLAKSEERFALAMRASNDGIWDWDVVTNDIVFSARWKSMIGYADDELVDAFETWERLVHPDDIMRPKQCIDDCLKGKRSSYEVEFRMHHKNGSWVDILARGFCVFSTPEKNLLRIVGTHVDITERKHSESEVRESAKKFRAIFEQAAVGVARVSTDGTWLEANDKLCEIIGYSRKELLIKTFQEITHPEDLDNDLTYVNQLLNGGINTYSMDKRYFKKDGDIVWVKLTVSLVRKANNDPDYFISVIEDITDYEILEEQLRQSQKMEALGTLVGGIAHDFNNMLAGITGNLYLAKKFSNENPRVLKKLRNIESLSYRAADMVQQLLTFARKDRISMKPLPFTTFIKETLKLLRSSVSEDIALDQDICADSLIIKGDGTQIHQILLNLVTNACDALESSTEPRITIKLEAVHVDKVFIEKHMGFATGEYAHLSVQDNGCGIPEVRTGHLFEPFFTTKEVGKGTGLGLAMVFGAVKSHHGYVEVESVEGEGSTFHIYLPRVTSEKDSALSKQEGDVTEKAQGETILFVDDQSGIVETGKEVLESIGYRVMTAANGQQAVDTFKEHSGTIDLILMDIVMPVLSGDKAAQLIRQIDPNMKIIFSTGYDKDSQLDMGSEIVVSKPFAIEKLSQLIRKTIDA